MKQLTTVWVAKPLKFVEWHPPKSGRVLPAFSRETGRLGAELPRLSGRDPQSEFGSF